VVVVVLPHQAWVVEVGLLQPERNSTFMTNIIISEVSRRFHMAVTVYLIAVTFHSSNMWKFKHTPT
jgi:hypothetical protein